MTAARARRRGIIGGAGAVALSDDFNRADSTNLGSTSVGSRAWQELIGDWDIYNNRVRNLSGTNPIAVVDSYTTDVDISLDVSYNGRDSIVFRALDESNYLRLSVYRNVTSGSHTHTTCTNIYEKQCACEGDSYEGSCAGVGCYTQLKTSCGSCPSCNCTCCIFSSGCDTTSTVCDQDCTTTTHYTSSTTSRIYLDKIVNGSVQQINYWGSGSPSNLRVRTEDDQITMWYDNNLISTVTENAYLGETRHGVGRSQRGNGSGTALDNFDLALV